MSRPTPHHLRRTAALLAGSLLLAACGQKGPLYLPAPAPAQHPPAKQAPAKPPAD